MDWHTFFGYSALVTSVVVSCIGMPAQIIKNFRRKSTEGLSLLFNLFLFLNIGSWLCYGASMEPVNKIMIVANSFGVTLLGILLIQFALYRGRHPR